MSNDGLLVVVSGFSGSGKNTLVENLYKKYPNSYVDSVSVTTRTKREDEIEGESYYFKTYEEFEDMLLKGELLEWTTYAGQYYGTPKSSISKSLDEGKTVVMILNTMGAKYLKSKYNALLVFITPPSISDLKQRLLKRNTESKSDIDKRIKEISKEITDISYYDYLIVNDDIDKSVDRLHSIIEVEKYNVSHQKKMINSLKTELGINIEEDKFK